MILPSDQVRLLPPHWSARRRQTRHGRRKKVPRGSSWRSFSLAVRPFLKGSVGLRMSMTATMTMAPMGRLTVRTLASGNDIGLSLIGLTVKTPPPAHIRRKRPTKQRPNNTGNAHRRPYSTHPSRPLLQRNRINHKHHPSIHQTRGSHSRNRSSNNESHRIRRGAADRGSDLEDYDQRQVDVFRGVEGVDAAEEEGGAAGGQEEGAAVPAYFVEGVEFVCEGGEGCGDDCAVLGLLVC